MGTRYDSTPAGYFFGGYPGILLGMHTNTYADGAPFTAAITRTGTHAARNFLIRGLVRVVFHRPSFIFSSIVSARFCLFVVTCLVRYFHRIENGCFVMHLINRLSLIFSFLFSFCVLLVFV